MRIGTSPLNALNWHAIWDPPFDRTVLLEMALLWSRLAEIAAKAALPPEPLSTA